MPNFKNRALFHGENLDILRGMDGETVDLIATDPPFNKGRDFHATPDSLAAGAKFQDRWDWTRDTEGEWHDQMKDESPAVWGAVELAKTTYGEDMAAFLCFMGVRLMEIHRVLKPSGSLYLHCDPTASHYLRVMCDAVFGQRNFRNEIAWKRSGGKSDAKRFGRTLDRLLYYTKSDKFVWNQQYQAHDPEYIRKTYSRDDNDGRGAYTTMPLHAAGVTKDGDSGEAWRGIDPGAKGRHWGTPVKGVMSEYIIANELIPGWPDAYPTVRDRLDALDEAGLVVYGRGGLPRVKTYLAATKGIAATDLIADIPMASGRERVGYPTQKPLALYERIIKASSNPGDMVLDPFAGCATTPIAAERLGRQWVGIDIWDGAYEMIRRRMAAIGLASPDTQSTLTTVAGIHYETVPPVRTDGGLAAAPHLAAKYKRLRPQAEWQKMSRADMSDVLAAAQRSGADGDLVVCAGCGRALESRFFHLDHRLPSSEGGEHFITNRVLLCAPCNQTKSDKLTLTGLWRKNGSDGWMRNLAAAKEADQRAQLAASRIRDEGDAAERERLTAAARERILV